MPYPMPRPIPTSSSTARDRGDHVFTGSPGAGPRSVSPVRNTGMRRRSSTFKNALFSILGSSNSAVQEESSNLPKNHSTGSISSGGSTRRGSLAVPEATACSKSRSQRDYAMPAADGEEMAVSFSFQGSDVGPDEYIPRSATTTSSMTSRSAGSQSLQSFGKEFLTQYLTDRGLLLSRVISETPDLRLTVATSGDHVFLPTMSSNDDEYLARLNGLRGEEEAMEIEPEFSLDRPSSDVPTGAESQLRESLESELANEESAISDDDSDLSEDGNGESGVDYADNQGQRAKNSATASPVTPTFEIDSSMATYTIAVVLSLNKQTTLSNIKGELCSRVRVHWNNGVPPTKSFYEEFYCAGSMEWDLNPENANLFVPQNVSSEERIIENNRNLRPMRLFKNISDENRFYLDKNKTRTELLKKVNLRKTQVFQAGDYVFIIPVVFSNHIPESLYLPSARVNYRFRVATKIAHVEGQESSTGNNQEEPSEPIKIQETDHTTHRRFSNSILKKIKNNLHITNPVQNKVYDETKEIYAEYPLDVVRTPPLVSISTANKPVYINRVWANSLSYEISFAQKYVSLGSKVPVKIKLAPMSKNVCLKRLKISLVEKITFVSKNYEYEYDQIDPVAKDPYNPYFSDFSSKRKKERTVSLLEVSSSEKGSRALREEIVQNCVDENLLAYSSAEGDNGQPSIGITEPLMIETTLEFPKYEDLNKKTARTVPPYGIDIYTSVPNPEIGSQAGGSHRSGVIGFLANRKNSLASQVKGTSDVSQPVQAQPIVDEKFHETKIRTNAGIPVQFHTNLNVAKRGLYLSSLHFSNIYSKHKLEFMLRISKPDDRDPKRLRHYEVLIDTPIFIVSELCNSGNMDLPTYDMATNSQLAGEIDVETAPPTFEEAISVPNSPVQSPVMSPIGSPNVRANYDPDELSIQQINLSRSNSAAGPPDSQAIIPPQMTLTQSIDPSPRFNNLDKLLSTTPGASGADLSRSPNTRNSNLGLTSQSNGLEEPSQASIIFKKGYSVSARNAVQGDVSEGSSSEGLDGGVSINSSPPSYDEVRPLMSDEE